MTPEAARGARKNRRPAHKSLGRRIEQNVAAVASIEAAELRRRSPVERACDAIASFAGSVPFVVIHVIWFAAWTVWNSGVLGTPFDPFPFSLLTLVVSLEAIFLSTFVLMSQNRMSRISEQRARLDLQIDLLAESEMTKVLKTVQAIAEHLEVPNVVEDEETRELEEPTDIASLVEALDAGEESARKSDR